MSDFMSQGVRAAVGAVGPILNTTQYGAPANQNAQGQQGGGGVTVQGVFDFLQKKGITLNPNDVLNDQYARNEAQANAEFGRQQQGAAYLSGLANSNRNQETQRSMALNTQQNAANNVANQLNALQQARQTNANAITAAFNAGTAGIR